MTYARARLWLGIAGVGTSVIASIVVLALKLPDKYFSTTTEWEIGDVMSLTAFVLGFAIVMAPLDIIGGYLLPNKFGRSTRSLIDFLRSWMTGVGIQSLLFIVTGLLILFGSRVADQLGALLAVAGVAVAYLGLQGWLARLYTRPIEMQDLPYAQQRKLNNCIDILLSWKIEKRPLVIVDHNDPGFTGGVAGLPGRESIFVPQGWLETLSADQLAAVIARRLVAIENGSRTRGVLAAGAYILIGFGAATLLTGGAVNSVAQLVTICAGYTIWSFLGLLVLPTVSRQAAYGLDQSTGERGVPLELIRSALLSLDRLQDDEPNRSSAIETIFHPVPSVENRRMAKGAGSIGAWHAARTALFLSWACLGLLSRAVHCNAGRTELWTMLPTD